MRSRVASDVSHAQRERVAAMTPAERVALALRMGRDGLASYMATHHVDRQTARSLIERTRHAGRRPSRAAGCDDD